MTGWHSVANSLQLQPCWPACCMTFISTSFIGPWLQHVEDDSSPLTLVVKLLRTTSPLQPKKTRPQLKSSHRLPWCLSLSQVKIKCGETKHIMTHRFLREPSLPSTSLVWHQSGRGACWVSALAMTFFAWGAKWQNGSERTQTWHT